MSFSETGCKDYQRFFGGVWMIRHGRPALKISALLIVLGLLSCTSATLAQCIQESFKLNGSGMASDHLGLSVAVSGDVAVVRGFNSGCPGYDYGSLYAYRRDGATWVEEAHFCAAGGGVAFFDSGVSVSVSGDVAALGAYFDDCAAGERCGSVHVYRFDAGAPGLWIEEQKLTASDAVAGAKFGFSVSVSGEVLIVPSNNAAYIYRFIPGVPGQWVEEQKLTPSDPAYRILASASVSGNVAVVPAYRNDCTPGSNCGLTYVFRYNGNTWVEEAQLMASGRVSVDGDVVVIGYTSEGCAGGVYCGAASVFRFDGTAWGEEAKLTASDAAANEGFGASVSVSGDLVVVRAPGDYCVNGKYNCGSVYVYRFNGSTWSETGKLTASDAEGYDQFFDGSVSVSGDTVVMGAPWHECFSGSLCGTAYVFEMGHLPPPPDCNENGVDDGCDIAYRTIPDCDRNFIPDECDIAACTDDPACADCNANSIPDGCEKDCDSNGIPDDCDIRDCSGNPACSDCNSNIVPDACDIRRGVSRDVDASGIPDECELGACCNESTGACTDGVPIAVCAGDECSWHVNRLCADLDPPCNLRTGACCDFGTGVCRNGLPLGLCSDDQQRWVRGASCADVGCAGDRADVCAVQTLPNPEGMSQQYFGRSVAIDGDVAIAGSTYPDCAAGSYCGAAYVYRFNSNGPEWWVQEGTLTASDAAANAYFGGDVSISGDVAVVGAYGADCYFCGAAYVFRYNGVSWIEEQKLLPPISTERDGFGGTVSIDGDVAVVGASGEDCDLGPDCGAAYVYRFNGVTWSQEAKLVPSNTRREDYFAATVSVSGDVIVVGGSHGECADGRICGAALVYRYSGTTWVEEQAITTLPGWGSFQVSVSGDVALVSAFLNGCPPNNAAGISGCTSAFVYRFHPGTEAWVQEKMFEQEHPSNLGLFGSDVAISGDLAVIGALYDNCEYGNSCDQAYVFRYNGRTWVENLRLRGVDDSGAFGSSVAISNESVIIGAPNTPCAAGYDCGSVYVFALGPDCNFNGDADFCDIRDGYSSDSNSNIIPDECEGGACCDGVTGVCEDNVPGTQCHGDERSWSRATPCVDIDPPCTGHSGACCDHDPFGGCVDGVMSTSCGCPTCEWFALADCSSVDCPHAPIPTADQWGLIILTLLLLTGAKIRFGRVSQSGAST